GPDFLPFTRGFNLYGVDFSAEMLKFARKYSQKFNFAVNLSLADVRHLPYSDATFDWAISVATYHHVKGTDERQAALNELGRVLKPGGEAFITVWNRWQPRFWFSGREVVVPWRKRNKTLYRYYYLFSYLELEKQAKKAGFKVLKSFPENSYHFPTLWPPANYGRELQNRLGRYIVACDEEETVEEPKVEASLEKGISGLASKVRRLFNHNRFLSNEPPSSGRQYIKGFAGLWIMADEAHITNIAVRGIHRRQGIGELLLILVIALVMELNARIITLEVRA
ncbi:unnamed protein product, partial [marine sediment metagenome]